MTTHVHLVRGRSEKALSRRSSFVVDSDAGDSSDAGDEAVDDSISSDAGDSSDDDDSDDSSDDDDSDDLSPTPYESTIVSCKADTREGAETWSYWAEAFSNVEFSGHLDQLWANRRSNDLQLHCNRYCIVIDTATGQEGRRQDKSLRTIDIVVYPSFRGRGHGRRTAHCVVRRLVRQGLTVQCTVSTQSKAKPVQKIFNTVPGVVASETVVNVPHVPATLCIALLGEINAGLLLRAQLKARSQRRLLRPTSAAARQVPRHMPLRVRVVVHACVA